MMCCGSERKTPFCPECGKNLREPGPLDELLAHARQTARNFRSGAKRWRKRYEDDGIDPNEFGCKQIDRCQSSAEKWDKWADALEELMRGKA